MKNPLTPERIARDSTSGLTRPSHRCLAEGGKTPDESLSIWRRPHITYGAIARRHCRLVTGLRKLGLEAGRRDQLSSYPTGANRWCLISPPRRMGLVVNPVVPIYRDHELRFILADAGTRLIYIPEQIRSLEFPSMIARLAGRNCRIWNTW